MVHYGAPKSWYCVPPKYGHLLEKLAKEVFSETSTLCTNFMRHKTCIISPKVLEKHNIPYNKLVQKAREIIIVFPYAYHSGFNHGFNIHMPTTVDSIMGLILPKLLILPVPVGLNMAKDIDPVIVTNPG